jgi:RNA polymerase sigma-70 factor (ECF subfamily)
LDAWASNVIPRAVAYGRTLLRQPSEAEDIVQDVLCRLLAHPEYDLAADGEKLLFRSVTNACINRETRRRPVQSLDAAPAGGAPRAALVAAKGVPDPSEDASARETHERIRAGLATLPSLQRAALELKSMSYSLQEVSGMLDVTVSHAGVLVHRARKALAAFLEQPAGGGTYRGSEA